MTGDQNRECTTARSLTFLSIPALADEQRPVREPVPFDNFEVREEMVPMRALFEKRPTQN